MIKIIKNNRKAIVILHEIYGTNRFIEDVCAEYHMLEFDVFCPDMLRQKCFFYSEASEAYHYFINEIGFDFYKEIEQLVELLQPCCPVLLLFAEQDSFDVDSIIIKLQEKSNVEIYKLMASHGFLDCYSGHFNMEQTQISKEYISSFFLKYTYNAITKEEFYGLLSC